MIEQLIAINKDVRSVTEHLNTFVQFALTMPIASRQTVYDVCAYFLHGRSDYFCLACKYGYNGHAEALARGQKAVG